MPPPRKSAATAASNVHVILGTDEARVKEAALKLVQRLTPPDAGDFANDVIDGTADNAEMAGQICNNVIQALQTLPFFGGAKVVWLKNANFLGDSVTGRAQAAVTGFENVLDVLEGGIGSDVKFVLSATSIDKRRSAYKRLGKLAAIEVHDKPDTSKAGWEEAVMMQASKWARERGLTFETGALELLVQMAGDDTRQLESELEKIDLYLGERRRAGVATVRGLVSMSRAGVIWEIGNAIGARDLKRALELLGILVYQGQNPVGLLLAAIVPKVRSLLLVKDLLTRHKLGTGSYNAFNISLEALPAAATAHVPRKKDGTGFNAYPLFLAVHDSTRFTLDELHAAFRACLDANAKLVTTQLDPKLVIERLLVGLLAPAKKRVA
ncbi:MAG: DNA polymerase III subunit delta [Verrucomicrobiaceae bacterium]|nr:DNA polymerase III subunit delta [Verrucomicrobiaceae bacterium]